MQYTAVWHLCLSVHVIMHRQLMCERALLLFGCVRLKSAKLFTVNLTREKINTRRWGPRGRELEGVRAHGGARAPREGKNCLAYPLLFFLSKVSSLSLSRSLTLLLLFAYTRWKAPRARTLYYARRILPNVVPVCNAAHTMASYNICIQYMRHCSSVRRAAAAKQRRARARRHSHLTAQSSVGCVFTGTKINSPT